MVSLSNHGTLPFDRLRVSVSIAAFISRPLSQIIL
jgi:hypothetical protein